MFGVFVLAYTGLTLLTNLQNALLVRPHNVLGAPLPFCAVLVALPQQVLQLAYGAPTAGSWRAREHPGTGS